MEKLSELIDGYSLKARLTPAFLVLLPFALAVWAWAQVHSVSLDWKVLGAVAVYCGCTFFLAQIGRDLGRKKEKLLFQKWGGKPTTRMLRYRDTTLDLITMRRYHTRIGEVISRSFPSAQQEQIDPKAADEIYESGVRMLLERTRDKSKYPLVFKENVNYGFRRNLWGMKPAGIFICFLSLGISLIPIATAIYNATAVPVPNVFTAVADVVFVTFWILRITPAWVNLPAEAYALRLLAACEHIESSPSTLLTK
jgi:hypothetical protein